MCGQTVEKPTISPSGPAPPGTRFPSFRSTPGASRSGYATLKGSFDKGVRGGNVKGAEAVGKAIAERSIEKGIKRVVFDRSGFLYHGRIRAVADAARKAGLEF